MPREVLQRRATTAAVNVSRLWMLPLLGLCLASFGLRCDARAVSSLWPPFSWDIQLFARHISPSLGHTTARNMPHIPLTHTHTHWDTLAHLAVGHIQSELLNTANTWITIAITSFRAGADKAVLWCPPPPCLLCRVSLCCGVLSVKRLRMLHKEELIN